MRMNDLLKDYLSRQNKRGVLRIEKPTRAVSCFYSLLKRRYYLWVALKVKPLPTNAELEWYVKEMVAVFMHLYGGDNPINTQSILD